MANINKIVQFIETKAPLEFASDWDNSGWQVFLGNKTTNKILLALSPTLDVVDQAIKNNCDLIITHHPLIFNKINKISTLNSATAPLIKAIQNNIQIYSAHTNLDVAEEGIAQKLAELLDLQKTKVLDVIEGDIGFGKKGELKEEMALNDFINHLKQVLSLKEIKLINPKNKMTIKKIALLPGSGGSFISKLKGIDLYITADVKYHEALDVNNSVVLDIGHFESERIILPVLEEWLQKFDVKIIHAQEKSPWVVV